MRTNIMLDPLLITQAMALSDCKTKRAIVEEALRTFIAVKKAKRKTMCYQDKLESIRLRLKDYTASESVIDVLRRDRDRT